MSEKNATPGSFGWFDKNFHSSLDSSPINAPKIYNIVGCQNPKTITGFRVYDDGKDDIETSDGDGTVPLTSAINFIGRIHGKLLR